MPTVIFSKYEFEQALPIHPETRQPLWTRLGLIDGQECYRISWGNPNAEIFVCSSVGPDGVCRGTGKDSIRTWLCAPGDRKALAKKLQRWVTRQKNWKRNLQNVLCRMQYLARFLRPCPECGTMMRLTIPKGGPNKDRLCVFCPAKDGDKYLNHHWEPLPEDEDE